MSGAMAYRPTRSNDWGFPRWRGYGSGREAQAVRLCDRDGCEAAGDCPAPKSPNSPERWYFCRDHAAEYNRGWDYFEGLSAEDAAAREAAESGTAAGYERARHYAWAGPGDGTRSRDERRALDVLGLDDTADTAAIKAQYKTLVKRFHPDANGGDRSFEERLRDIIRAHDVLRAAGMC